MLGFESAGVVEAGAGQVVHAEVHAGDRRIWLHAAAGGLTTPQLAGAVTGGIVVHVADVDAHFRHTPAARRDDRREPTDEDYGQREYSRTRSRGPRLVHRHAVQRHPPR